MLAKKRKVKEENEIKNTTDIIRLKGVGELLYSVDIYKGNIVGLFCK